MRRIVYSTCSINCEENEHVVERALDLSGGQFRLEAVYPQWQRRGIITEGFFDGTKSFRNSFYLIIISLNKLKAVFIFIIIFICYQLNVVFVLSLKKIEQLGFSLLVLFVIRLLLNQCHLHL